MTSRENPLRIVHIGTADKVGGAARAQWRMHESLLAQGIDSRILCGFKSAEDERVAQVPAMSSLPAKAVRKLAHKAERLTGREYHLLPWGKRFLQHPWIKQADVIHLHNLHGGFFPIKLLPKLAKIAPLVWSVHDLWPTTGHCYFPQMTGCKCWTGEHPCIDPQQDDWYPLMRDTSRMLWDTKRKLVAAARPTYIAQSAFTEQWLAKAPITRQRPTARIPYPLDVQTFVPTTKDQARAALSLPPDGAVAMFSAVSLSHPRKGGADVIAAVRTAAGQLPGILTLLAVGADASGLNSLQNMDQVHIVPLGQIDDDARLALAYSAADVFIGASKVETFGQVFSEAAACETPGVAYFTSGVSNAISHGRTGMLVSMGHPEGLAAELASLLTNDIRRSEMALRAREQCVKQYAYPVVAKQLIALYESRRQSFASRHG